MLGPVRRHKLGGDATVKKPKAAEPKKLNYAETRVQQELVKWLSHRPDWMVMRLENAQRRTPAQAARDKSMGMCTGAPDLVLLYRREVVFFEVKADDGEVKPAQKEVHEQLKIRNQTVLVGYGLLDCQRRIHEYESGAYGRRT